MKTKKALKTMEQKIRLYALIITYLAIVYKTLRSDNMRVFEDLTIKNQMNIQTIEKCECGALLTFKIEGNKGILLCPCGRSDRILFTVAEEEEPVFKNRKFSYDDIYEKCKELKRCKSFKEAEKINEELKKIFNTFQLRSD